MNDAGRTDRYRPSRRGKRFRSSTPEHWLTKRSGREGKIHADGHVLCRRSPAGRGMPFPAPGVMRDGRFGPFGHTCRRGASVTGEDIQGPGRSCTPCCRRRFESVPGRRMTATPCDESQGVFFVRFFRRRRGKAHTEGFSVSPGFFREGGGVHPGSGR